MTTDDAAFSAFRQATESLTGLSESHQVRALEFELFRAIHRNHELQREMKTLEWKVIKLEGDGAATLDAFARHLHAELVRARDELAEARTAFARERGAMEEKVHAADKRAEVLEELVRTLLRTIERAAAISEGGPDAEAGFGVSRDEQSKGAVGPS